MTDLAGKTVVITGGTGSFGRTAARRLLQDDIHEIRIFSRDEAKQDDMRRQYGDGRLSFHLGDVRDRDSVDGVMRNADLVFHAAALKQVPSCEFFPMQAVQTNVQGSDNVVRAAIHAGVRRVICLGTDKAAYPVNTMGMTKALMEKVAQAHARLADQTGTVVATVRYGNVLASRGSVVPLFVEQLIEGVPLTVTEPTMTRFLLSLPEAMELVMHALDNAQPGDLFIRKAPACTVGDLSSALRSLFGSQLPDRIIGMRHGEKLFETLATREELARAEDMGDYYRIRMDDRDLNYGLYFSEGEAGQHRIDDYTSHNSPRMSVAEVETLLQTLPLVREALARSGQT